MIINEFIDTVLYFMAFIPIIMMPLIILELAPFFVISGIGILLKADQEENSAENYFGIEVENDLKNVDYNETDTYALNKKIRKEKFKNVRFYIVFRLVGIVIVSVLLGFFLSNGLVEIDVIKNFGISKSSTLFVISSVFYIGVMLSLFNQFKDSKFNNFIISSFFTLDSLIGSINASIIILIFKS